MDSIDTLTRRTFLASAAVLPATLAAAPAGSLPIGLELYSVRDNLNKDLAGTIRAVAQMGYQAVEFYAPYMQWTAAYARQVRTILDDNGIRCNSTHNGLDSFSAAKMPQAIELNRIIGSRYVVLAHPGKTSGLDDYKRVAETLSGALETLKPAGLSAGYHNHDAEWRPLEGRRPIEIIAANTPRDLMLQLDVGTCVEAGSDPVAWVRANPGRIRSMHCKDWSPEKGYKVLFGEGVTPWKELFAAAESTGGVEFYLIEQEGSDYPEMETAERCLAAFRKIHG